MSHPAVMIGIAITLTITAASIRAVMKSNARKKAQANIERRLEPLKPKN